MKHIRVTLNLNLIQSLGYLNKAKQYPQNKVEHNAPTLTLNLIHSLQYYASFGFFGAKQYCQN